MSDCKMQEGSLRCDVNLSVRPAGSTELGTRTEMKNINSFKAIARAIAYETRRQIELIEDGKRVIQETRRWDENKDATYSMRSKENAQDYRYFPEPDIPPMEITEEYLDSAAGGAARDGRGEEGTLCGRVRPAGVRCRYADRPEGAGRLL